MKQEINAFKSKSPKVLGDQNENEKKKVIMRELKLINLEELLLKDDPRMEIEQVY